METDKVEDVKSSHRSIGKLNAKGAEFKYELTNKRIKFTEKLLGAQQKCNVKLQHHNLLQLFNSTHLSPYDTKAREYKIMLRRRNFELLNSEEAQTILSSSVRFVH